MQNKDGDTVSIFVSEYGDINALKIFVDAGADMSIKNKKRKTALDMARVKEKTEIVKYLESLQ